MAFSSDTSSEPLGAANDATVTQVDRDAVTHAGLPYLSAFVTAGYAFITVGHIYVLPPELQSILVPLSVMSVVVGLAVLTLHRRGAIPVSAANWVASLLSFIIIANAATHLFASGEVHQAVNLGLAIMVFGLVHLCPLHLAISYLVIAAIWGFGAVPLFEPDIAVHYSYFLFNSLLGGVVSFAIRWHAFNSAIGARKLAEKSEAELQVALRRTRIAEEAEKASRAQREFLANMNHELRTPLNAIIGFSDIMRHEQFGPIENDAYREYVIDINEAGISLLSIINDVLDLSRLQSNELDVDEEPVDIEALAARVEKIIRFRGNARALRMNFTVHPRARLVTTDGRRLMQALVHLIGNAIKFTPEGGQVVFEAGVDDMNPEASGIFFRVTDTGIGMTEETIEHAVRPFWQSESVTARQYGGMGLGLPLTHAFAELLGGHLEIRSRPGEGTTATIWLPLSKLATRETALRLTA